MDIVGGIAAATQAISIAKALRGIEKSYDQATYRAQMAELLDALTDAKLALTDAKEVLAERDKDIDRLKAAFEMQGTLKKLDGGYQYLVDDQERPDGFPVCPKCAADGRIIQLVQDGRAQNAKCPSCATEYTPVTCYTSGGSSTLQEDQAARRAAATDRANAAIARGRNSYF